jgi:hypothetical protein
MPKAGTPLTFAEGSKVFWDNSAKTCKASSAEYYCIPRSLRHARMIRMSSCGLMGVA